MKAFHSVLYVDDDPDICAVVKLTLSLMAGLKVETALSGDQGVAMAIALRPDLILMDVMMPGLDGPGALERMRQIPRIAEIPVIFMTAKVLPAELAHFRELGVIGVIGKPFDPAKLADDLSAVWSRATATRIIRSTDSGRFEVQQRVSSLTSGFLQRTRGDILELGLMIERAMHGDRTMFAEIERVSHSIHGAGAMFGFSEVSASGGALERLAAAAGLTTAASGAAEPAVLQQLRELTAELGRLVEAAEQAGPKGGAMFQPRGSSL
jgi:CheY-like chemotaxis protein